MVMVEENYAKDVYQYLIKKLSIEQKKDFIKESNITFGSMQTRFIKNDQQWNSVIKILESKAKLKTIKVQKAIRLFYLTHIVPELETNMIEDKSFEELTMEELEEIIQEKGLDYVLMFLVLEDQYGKAKNLVDKYENINTPLNEFLKENENIKQSHEVDEVLKNNLDLIKKNKILGEKNNKNKTLITELERSNKDLKEKLITEKRKSEETVKKLTSKINLKNQEIERVLFENDEYKKSVESDLKMISELKDKIVELQTDFNETITVSEVMLEEQTELLKESKTKEITNKKVLVFGELPYKNKAGYDITIFNGDFLNYEFNENYDEYWCVIDKISGLNKRNLRKNSDAKKINLIQFTYMSEVNKSIRHKEYAQ